MEAINKALNNTFDMRTGPTKEKILSDLASVERLLSKLESPQYRHLICFAVAWKELERALTELERKVDEIVADKPINPLDEFVKTLIKKN